MKICVADDEREVRESIIHKLTSLFPFADIYDVEFGNRAFELLQIVRPDLVFLDIRMPEKDGLDILGLIKQAVPSIEVVILSGYDDFEYARKALQRGAFDYLLKPADREELREVVLKVKAQMELRFREEIDDYLYKLSDEYVFIHDIQYYNTSLWFDERQYKRIEVGEPGTLPEAGNPDRDVLIEFGVNHESRGVVSIDAEEPRSKVAFAEKKDFVKALAAAIGNWESLRFFGEEPTKPVSADNKAIKEAALRRQRILHAAKAGDISELQTVLEAWLEPLGKMGMKALKAECVNLMAMLDEGLARNDAVFFLDEEKRHYWWQWVSKHKTWEELQTDIRKFVVGGVRALKKIEEQPGHHWFEQALQWIDQSKDPTLNLESVAEAVGVHPVTLSRLFKQQTGMNFVKYLVRRRLQNARTLLLKTDKKINEIAEEVGYVDYRYFRTLFKKEFGLSPSEYRSRNGIKLGHDEPEDGG